MRHGNGTPSAVRTLTKIDPQTWPKDRLLWLWGQLLTQDYAYDDMAQALGAQGFLNQLFQPASEWYEVGDDGIVVASGILPKCNAMVHFAQWGDIELREMFPIQTQWFDSLFTRWQLNRLTAYIPAFNKQAVRMVTLTGFKYEGEMRKAFLKHGTYHNLLIYGILREEFYKRQVPNA